MSIYLGNTKMGKIYIGDTKIGKVYLGSTLLYNSNSQPTGEGLYTTDNGTVLVLGTGYNIPTTIHDIESGTTTTTISSLSSPLSFGNLTASSYGDNYNYNPNISETTPHTSFSPSSESDPGLVSLLYNTREQDAQYPSITLVRISNQTNRSYTPTSIYIQNLPQGYEGAKLSVGAYLGALNSLGSTNPINFTVKLQAQSLAAGQPVLAEVTRDNIVINPGSNLTYFTIPLSTDFDIPSAGMRFMVDVSRDGDALQDCYIARGKLNFRLHKYNYNIPRYVNISRNIYQGEGYEDDTTSISLSDNDINAQYIMSISDSGVATLSKKETEE